MSIELMTKVWKTDVGPATKRLALLALADSASDTGECWPTLGTLAIKVGVSKSSLREWVRRLEADGVILRRFRVDQSSIYRVNVNVLNQWVAESEQQRDDAEQTPTEQPAHPHRTTGAPSTGQSADPHRAAGAPPTEQPVPEPSLNPQGTLLDGKDAGASGSSKSKSKPRTRLPSEWEPTDNHRVFAVEHGLDLEREVFRFRSHAEATGRVMASWNAAFTTWLDKARDMRPAARQERRDPKSGMLVDMEC